MKKQRDDSLYRSNVGILICNAAGDVFLGKRVDSRGWQMPQGGVEVGETEDVAMFRELEEEVGLTDNFYVEAKSANHYYYELPNYMKSEFWNNRYIGQKQRWYKLRFFGIPQDIKINQKNREFSDWSWVTPQYAAETVIDFKREIYTSMMKEFGLM